MPNQSSSVVFKNLKRALSVLFLVSCLPNFVTAKTCARVLSVRPHLFHASYLEGVDPYRAYAFGQGPDNIYRIHVLSFEAENVKRAQVESNFLHIENFNYGEQHFPDLSHLDQLIMFKPLLGQKQEFAGASGRRLVSMMLRAYKRTFAREIRERSLRDLKTYDYNSRTAKEYLAALVLDTAFGEIHVTFNVRAEPKLFKEHAYLVGLHLLSQINWRTSYRITSARIYGSRSSLD